MTTTLQQAINKVEEFWGKIEAVGEADAKIIGNAIGGFLTMYAPSQLSVLFQVVADAGLDLIVNPGGAATAILNDLSSKELAWWKGLQPVAQNRLLDAVVAIQRANATVGVLDTTSAAPAAPQ